MQCRMCLGKDGRKVKGNPFGVICVRCEKELEIFERTAPEVEKVELARGKVTPANSSVYHKDWTPPW